MSSVQLIQAMLPENGTPVHMLSLICGQFRVK